MAHKNWSKEQFKLKYFFFSLTFSNIQLNPLTSPSSALFLFLTIGDNFKFFETNLLHLKSYYLT